MATNIIDIKTGVAIRRLRETAGLTQEVLSKRIGISYQQLQKYEQAKNRLSVSRLFDIAKIVGVETHVIVKLVEFELEAENF